ncbi:MAG: lytic transglycosylase domain-containing protein [Alphaproteobacteria bacterium]
MFIFSAAAELALWHIVPMPGGDPRHSESVAEAINADTIDGTVFSNLPVLLSGKDRGLYKEIFSAQKRQDWIKADILAAKLSNQELLGHVLAYRYLHKSYTASPAELSTWLSKYSDHPQTADITSLARSKNASIPVTSEFRKHRQPLQGYGDDNGLASWNGNSVVTWHQAMQSWKSSDKINAARLFSSIANQDGMHRWKKAGAAFWAWRSYKAIGDQKSAYHYLRIAASEPRSFYGILARRELKQSLGLDKTPVTLSDSDVLEIIGEPVIRRVIALSEAGASEFAEKELRTYFPTVDKNEQMRLLALAHDLNLASVQIAMARHLRNETRALDFARYPVPHWQPQEGFRVEPALIYALARQESGFHAMAKSPAGALGVMQLMPETASLMKKQMQKNTGLSASTYHASDAVSNVTLGQGYVEHLLGNALVENNLLFMLTAYNAGPGRLMEWKKSIDYKNDPLLFLESIPFPETRNYVMQVMTNYWIYSELAGKSNSSIYALLSGKWPSYQPIVPLAARNLQTAS